MSNFQTILSAIFLAFFVFAVLIFSGALNLGNGKNDNGLQGKVVIWGTFPNSTFASTIQSITSDNRDLSLNYKSKDSATYQQDLIEAFANGTGPDLFVITPDMVIKNENFIYKIPYESLPRKTFTDTYIEGADIFLDSTGIVGFPLVVDPIVLYYNKDILTNEGIVYPPKTWDELFTLNATLTKRDNIGTISRSMIALGQDANVNNFKDILATLLIQNDNPIVQRTNGGFATYESTLDQNPKSLIIPPVTAVVEFFLSFSNLSNTAYSWNRSLPNSLDMFTSGKLAFYIGRASELFNIESINPNLSFDVTQIPQIKDAPVKRTYGEIYALVVSKKSTNLTSAFGVASLSSMGENAKNISIDLSLPPVSRSLLADKPSDLYLFTFFNSALISRSWLDPDPTKTDSIFRKMIESKLSNNSSTNDSITKAREEFQLLFNK